MFEYSVKCNDIKVHDNLSVTITINPGEIIDFTTPKHNQKGSDITELPKALEMDMLAHGVKL